MAYQRPTNPAPVSGPGAMSQRTDGGPSQPTRVAPGGDYGDRTEMVNLQQSAPMAASAAAEAPAPATGMTVQPPTPLTDPTQRPDEPVTHGAPAGAGAGPEILGLGKQMRTDAQAMQRLLPVFEQVANSDPDYRSMRLFVQYLKGL